ncbi:MAG: sugar transferase [Candidatus Moranbacteria bacterium]|nr:sugar transferase [Candidatus Moranbacteria bacterium]
MKRSELFFSGIQVPVDYAMVVLASLTAFAIRDIPQVVSALPKLYQFSFNTYLDVTFIIAGLMVLVYAIEGLYDIRSTRKFWQEAFKVFSATSLGLVIIIVAIFLKREWFSSRFIILSAWMFAVVYVVFVRYLMQKFQKWLVAKRGIGVHRIALIGTNGRIRRLKSVFKKNPSLGYKVIGVLETGSIKAVKELRLRQGIDEIIVCDPTLTDGEQEKLVDYCAINNIVYKYVPTTLQTARFTMKMFDGGPMIEVEHTPLDGWGKILKRIFDIIASLTLIVLSSPIMLIVALLIKIEDRKGPIVYKNERIGENGVVFYVYKFRYMQWKHCITKENPELKAAIAYEQELIKDLSIRKGPLYKIQNDPRKMRVGAFIERYSLDELPQFFNVLLGTMSLVGPRPHQKREVEKYKEYHRRLLTVKPGVTGMAQVAGRSDLAFEDEYKIDLFYIENWSLLLDIQLCFKTVGVLFRRRKN